VKRTCWQIRVGGERREQIIKNFVRDLSSEKSMKTYSPIPKT
jgi:hypothetical protein